MKRTYMIFMTLIFSLALLSATAWGTTYFWVGGSGSVAWVDGSTWNTTLGGGGSFRTSPSTSDILTIDGTNLGSGATGVLTITSVPIPATIGQLLLAGNATVNLQAGTAGTLTISGGAGSLTVPSGCTLNINGALGLIINLATGSTGSVSGNMTFSAAVHKLTAADASGVTFNNGASFTQGASCTGNVFGTGTANSIVFASGSTFVFTIGSNPFALTAPASVVAFQTGSTFSHQSTNTPSFSGRTYANFQLNLPGSTITVTGPSAVSIDNLTITAGTMNFNMTAAPGHAIKGNITVASGAVLNFNPATAGTVNLGGSALQTISAVGTISSGLFSTLNVSNNAGVILGTNLSIPGNLSMSQGNIALGGNTLTLGASGAVISPTGNTTSGQPTIASVSSTAGVAVGMSITGSGIPANTVVSGFTANSITLSANATATATGVALTINSTVAGALTYTGGFVTGSGTFTRWIPTAAISGTQGLFPMGVGSNNRSLAIGGSPSTGGPVSVSYNDAITVSSITFSENAQNFVNRYDANWVVTPSGGYTDPAMTLTIHGDGIPGITSVADLDVSALTTIATGAWAAPSGTPSAPVLTRNGLTQGTIVVNPFYFASTNASPLPVEITSFTSLAGSKSVELCWNTAAEVNNYGFDVERRSMNNQQSTINSWAKLGFVSGNGTTNAVHNYSFTDNSTSVGKYSYRLKQIDRDGKFQYSATVEATVGLTPNTMVLGQNYPNPFNPETNIEFAVPATGHATLKVYNMLGEQIATLVNGNIEAGVLNHVSFKGSSFPSGMYFYTLRSANFVDTKKMLMVK